jgi:hypothetical protein
MNRIAKLERQIKELEKMLSGGNFSGLIDPDGRRRNEDKLRRLTKELEQLKKAAETRKPAKAKKTALPKKTKKTN